MVLNPSCRSRNGKPVRLDGNRHKALPPAGEIYGELAGPVKAPPQTCTMVGIDETGE
jgi:hypothetical protein